MSGGHYDYLEYKLSQLRDLVAVDLLHHSGPVDGLPETERESLHTILSVVDTDLTALYDLITRLDRYMSCDCSYDPLKSAFENYKVSRYDFGIPDLSGEDISSALGLLSQVLQAKKD